MSKIDLSKAKIGDKFRTRAGQILEYIREEQCDDDDKYILSNECGREFHFNEDGNYYLNINCDMDLEEQVFYVSLDMIEIDERKNSEMQKFVDYAKEENQELQRRQEVVELAEKMYIMFEKENLRCCLSCNGSNTYYSEDLQGMAFVRASSFVNKKHEYLKEGKL